MPGEDVCLNPGDCLGINSSNALCKEISGENVHRRNDCAVAC